MIAFAGSSAGSGTVTAPSTVTINASAAGTNTGGSVFIIAGATSGTAISVGNINASSGNLTVNGGSVSPGGVNSIQLFAATPSIPSIVVTGDTGLSASGNIGTTPTSGNIIAGNLLNASSTVSVTTHGNFQFNNIDVSGYGGTATTATSNPVPGSAGGNVNITAASLTGNNIFAYGGGGAGGIGSQSSSFNGGVGGAGGQVQIVCNTNANGVVMLAGQANVAGGGGGGGAGGDNFTGPGTGGAGGISGNGP
jgi:hypothetical protein